jgi:Ricin-type beta-trefoil lectin domain-like
MRMVFRQMFLIGAAIVLWGTLPAVGQTVPQNAANDALLTQSNVSNEVELIDPAVPPASHKALLRRVWRLEPVGQREFYIVNIGDDSVLDRKKGGDTLISWSRNGGKNQLWHFVPLGQGIYVIVSSLDGKALTSLNGSHKLTVAPRTDDVTQRWRLLPPPPL